MKLTFVALAMSLFGISAQAGELPPSVVAVTASELQWNTGGLALPGMAQANLIGAPDKPGPYTVRLRFPAGYKLCPHTHPDSRTVTVLKGVWQTGYGKVFDPALLKSLPAGSFYTEPANLSHFVQVIEEVEIQVSGTGPSGRAFIAESDCHN
jgi:hypothetical protein